MLTGTYTFSLDAKGRLVMPRPWRSYLEGPPQPVVLRAGEPGELILRPLRDDPGHFLPECYHRIPVERRTGRILLPHALRQHARLRIYDEVVLTGHGAEARLALWVPPLLEGQVAARLLAERDQLHAELGQLDAELDRLRRELARLRAGQGERR
jgi:DNA-binding transcriptional regulator/RsmH inhibitor MraZ